MLHLSFQDVREFLFHLLAVIHSPIARSNKESGLTVNIVSFKVPTKKIFNNTDCEIFKPILWVVWIKKGSKSITVSRG